MFPKPRGVRSVKNTYIFHHTYNLLNIISPSPHDNPASSAMVQQANHLTRHNCCHLKMTLTEQLRWSGGCKDGFLNIGIWPLPCTIWR